MMLDAEKTISFRAPSAFIEETKHFAEANHQQVSQYIRDAVREKNERQIEERMRFLSKRLSAEREEVSREFEAAAGDGLA